MSPIATATNFLGLSLVTIPAGEFLMGTRETPEEMADAYPAYSRERLEEMPDERPQHRVRITRPFDLGAHPVTIAQFRRFVEATGYRTEAERDEWGGWYYEPGAKAFLGPEPGYSWRETGFPQGDDHPVVNVTWGDAVAFCRWLGEAEGRAYRLPTEAEWEYACRAGSAGRYSHGDDPGRLTEIANVFDAAKRDLFPDEAAYALESSGGFRFTAPVGRFRPNAFGLYDMHGNVWEWCADWYDEHYYRHSPVDDPTGPETGRLRVRRGGGWHTWALYARSAYRYVNTPESRYINLGFRVVREREP